MHPLASGVILDRLPLSGFMPGRSSRTPKSKIRPPRVHRPRLKFDIPKPVVVKPFITPYLIPGIYTAGSFLFVVGASAAFVPEPYLTEQAAYALSCAAYLVGAALFTRGIYLEFAQVINGKRLGSWSFWGWYPYLLNWRGLLILLIGSLLFNLETIAAFFTELGVVGKDLLVALPSLLGGLCFTISSFLLTLDKLGSYWVWPPNGVGWWVSKSALIGSILFLFGASFGFEIPGMSGPGDSIVCQICYLIGSILFLGNGISLLIETQQELEKMDSSEPEA